jgi:hypothetical protein
MRAASSSTGNATMSAIASSVARRCAHVCRCGYKDAEIEFGQRIFVGAQRAV